MLTRHLVVDTSTGEVMTRGREAPSPWARPGDQRDHSEAAVAAAERAAEAGDEAAGALLASLAPPTDIDVDAWARQLMHDCPDCRAALAAGEQPIVLGPTELAALAQRSAPRGGRLFQKRPRWRDLKRGRR